jgi:hypothetical protein
MRKAAATYLTPPLIIYIAKYWNLKNNRGNVHQYLWDQFMTRCRDSIHNIFVHKNDEQLLEL